MSGLHEEIVRRRGELQNIPSAYHLLCPRVSDLDDENYKTFDDPESQISVAEKRKRIQDSSERIDITYWVSLIFGYDKKDAGIWGEQFEARLNANLEHCPDCVLNWHMQRKAHLREFAERFDDDGYTSGEIGALLDSLDVQRIGKNLNWAKEIIVDFESTGKVFKKAHFGERLGEVHIAVYEALCCVSYLNNPEQRALFQFVFQRLQGRSHLKLGSKDPLPGMVYFLFDQGSPDRRSWAVENWKNIDDGSMNEEQFEWAVQGALVKALASISAKDLSQATSEMYLEIQQFWEAFDNILRTMTRDLVQDRLRSLELEPGSASIFDLLTHHITHCNAEGVLVSTIQVLTSFLKISPEFIWDGINDAKPTVVAEMIFNSPVYHGLLRQSLEDCWERYDANSHLRVPLSTSWVGPWLKALGRDRRFDASDGLLHTLFGILAKEPAIGEPGQAACIRAGFDALTLTIDSFLGTDAKIVGSSTHLYANLTLDLVMKHKKLILSSLRRSPEPRPGHTSFRVEQAAVNLLESAMTLDTKLFSGEFRVLCDGQKLQSMMSRNSQMFWEGIVSIFDQSADPGAIAEKIMLSLEPLIVVEQIRPTKKDSTLNDSSKAFNQALRSITDIVARILGRISELDPTDLNRLFDDQLTFNVIVGLSIHGESDFAESASELLKSWTGELSRSGAIEHMSQQHPDRSLRSLVWCLECILKPPYPWGPIRPLLNMSRDILRGLADPSSGVLRTTVLQPQSAAIVLRWWIEQWKFVSRACMNIEAWSMFIPNSIMTEFCREIMELAEALIAEDSLVVSATCKSHGKSENEMMKRILEPAKEHFRGMENMIRLKDLWLVDVTVRVLRKILTRLRENGLEINSRSRKLITDACIPTTTPGKYLRSTNLTDQQRAELLEALGQNEDDDIQITKIGIVATDKQRASTTFPEKSKEKIKKQSRLDAWSKSGNSSDASTSSSKPARTNRDDVLAFSKSLENPILKQFQAAKAKPKVPDQSAISSLKEARMREKAEKAKRDAEAIKKAKEMRGETVTGEGSGILGLGVLGKDHSRSEIMVNSSDEDSEDSDSDSDDENQLAALSGGGAKALDEAEKRRLQALRDKTRRPVKKIRQQRSVKEMRARLIPPMDRLHNIVLAWDIFHQGNDPPSGPKASEVATRYPDPRSYQETFLPLLASEAWRSFVTAKDEITSQSFGMKIASRASVDSYLEITFTTPILQNRERGVSEGDILLISEAEAPLIDSSARHCLARVHRLTYKKDIVEITYRVSSRNNPLSLVLNPGISVYGVKITNMTTIEREYAALESLQYYDLMDEILKAEPSPIIRYGDEKVSNWMQNWSLNRAQALAVLGAHENDGFTLIQGPPGTGKTKTIVAMVGALLSEQLNQSNSLTALSRPANAPNPNNQARPKKLLVCAPSNAAVDELVLRMKSGLTTIGGKTRQANVLRLGRSDAINAAVKDVTLDELVRIRLEGDNTKETAKADREKLHEDAAKLKEDLGQLRTRLEESRATDNQALQDNLSRQFDQLKRQQMQIGKQIDANKESGNSIAREMDLRRRQIQQEILNSAHVLCATLSGSGHEMFRNLEVEFETVIIDEAAQCVELSALIPLKYGCCKCILVGDPKQLPPTVLSQSAARFGYDQSLFVRMQQNHPKSIHLLDMQYRMHPEISLFPSKEFYEGQLQDGQDMLRLRSKPWHKSALLGPYRFFDVEGVQERGRKGQSLVNTKELEVAMQIYDRFRQDFKGIDMSRKIGIITPYKAQLFELRARFKARFGEGITDVIEFNTTDAFQGRECEIIMFSCVRASPTGGIGFMTDIRRMNVGLTRAKSSLWVLGDSRALVQGQFWRQLIEDSKKRDRYTQGDILAMFQKPLEKNAGFVYEPPPVNEADNDVVMIDAPKSGASGANSLRATRESPMDEISRNGHGVPGLGRPDKVLSSEARPAASSGHVESGRGKRPLEGGNSSQPAAKRMANDKPRSGLMGKFGQKSAKPDKGPLDPSAMAVLGLVPPERPLPTAPSAAKPGPNRSSSEDLAKSSQVPKATGGTKPPSVNAANPQAPRKKAKPSLFLPKRR